MKPFEPRVHLWEFFLPTNSISLIDIGLFKLSISFRINFGSLCLLKSLSILLIIYYQTHSHKIVHNIPVFYFHVCRIFSDVPALISDIGNLYSFSFFFFLLYMVWVINFVYLLKGPYIIFIDYSYCFCFLLLSLLFSFLGLLCVSFVLFLVSNVSSF